MEKEVSQDINSYVPPASDVVIISALEYKTILDRIQQLQKLIDIYIDPNMDILKESDNSDWIAALKRRREAANSYGSRISDLEERLYALETALPSRTKKVAVGKITEERLLKVAITLINRRNNPISYVDIGKLLELGSRSSDGKKNTRKQNMTHLGKKIEEARERFIIKSDAQGHKYVHLTKIYYDHLVKEYIG